MNNRASGILLHITSLPDKLGLGCFSISAYDFIRFLNDANCKYWQVLPFNHCNYGESPYSSFSAFAGNPYFIDIRQFLSDIDIEKLGIVENEKLDATLMQEKLEKALQLIYSKNKLKYDLSNFIKVNKYWLDDYALFMAIRKKYKTADWRKFPTELKNRNKNALKKFAIENNEEINFYKFVQNLFFMQWKGIKDYANSLNVKIIGDMPIYVDMNSCDVWAHKEYFQIDENGYAQAVSGTPPEYFSKDGQLWGNPLYDFEKLGEDNYEWFLKRVQHQSNFFDMLRLDHFGGYVDYWSVPSKYKKSKYGSFKKGPGIELINLLKEKGKIELLLEDLGFLTKDTYQVKEKSKLPGIKIIQFGFDSGYSSKYLPHSFEKNCVAYIGNHDNDTFKGFLNKCDWEKINRIKNYLDLPHETQVDCVVDKMIRCIFSSSANIVIVTTQDLLRQDSECRMNTPSTVNDKNWKYQLEQSLNNDIVQTLKYYNEIFDRK